MKFRTSFFNAAVFRKDITRFAPAWVLYLVGGLLIMLTALMGRDSSVAAYALAQTMGPFAVINICYALLNGQLLFGDLFQSKLCYAQHAMPLRRECWFITHVAAGIFFSVVPNLIGVVCLLPTLQEFWYVGLYWLLAMTLHYLFFFAVAAFSALCTGSRFAMAAVYLLVNFISMLATWFVTTVYQPLMFGIRVDSAPFMLWCPVVKLCTVSFLEFQRKPFIPTLGHYEEEYLFKGFVGGSWEYLAIVAAVGVVFLVIALLVYRRRALEGAGDFITARPLAPVFSLVYTLAMGAAFYLVGQIMGGVEDVFFFIGLSIGYYTGQMLLQRTIRVFRLKTLAKFVLLLGLVIGSMVAVWLDPLGITRYVPEKEQIAWVDLDTPYSYAAHSQKFASEEEIQAVQELHRQILRENRIVDENAYHYDSGKSLLVYLTYTLKNGQEVRRYYNVEIDGKAWNMLRPLMSRPEEVMDYTSWEEFLYSRPKVDINGGTTIPFADAQTLLEAIKADCEAGNMAGHASYHKNLNWVTNIYIIRDNVYTQVRVYEDAENTIRWIKENRPGILANADNKY